MESIILNAMAFPSLPEKTMAEEPTRAEENQKNSGKISQ